MATPGDKLTPLDQLLAQEQGGQNVDLADQYRQLLQTAPPDVLAQAHADALAQLSIAERQRIAAGLRAANDDPRQAFQFPGLTGGDGDTDPRRLAEMVLQAQRQQPGLLDGTLGLSGGQGGGSNPIMQMVLAGVAALVMRQLLGGRASESTGQLGGGLGDILGQILGGGGFGGTANATSAGTGQGGMTSLDDLLAERGGQGADPGQSPSSGGLGDLGSILGQLAAGRGGGTQGGTGGLGDLLGQLGGSGNLGSILGQLAGGNAPADPEETPPASPRRQG